MSLPIIAVRWIEWIDKKQPQILHCVQDDSALESRNACQFGIVDGWWPTRRYRGFWDAKNNRRSFTAFRMTALWSRGMRASSGSLMVGGLLGGIADFGMPRTTADPSLRSGSQRFGVAECVPVRDR